MAIRREKESGKFQFLAASDKSTRLDPE